MKQHLFLFGLVALFTSPLAHGEITSDLSHPIPMIVDTDADLDDMMAILYLLKSPRASIKAITTVGDGMSRWEYGAKNISNLLELAGRSHIPVAYGAKKSLSPAGSFPKEWRDEADAVRGIKLPLNPVQPVRVSATDLMVDLIMNSPNKISLFCMGPLTNLAIAMDKTPAIKDNIDQLYIMGGVILSPGNIEGKPQGFRNTTAEYNIFLDAKGAFDVFNSGVPITLIPFDVVEQVPITKAFFDRLSKNRKTPSANFVYEVIKPFSKMHIRFKDYFRDSLAAVVMTHPEIATFRTLNLTINMRKGPEYGRVMMTKRGAPIKVCTEVDADAFYNIFLETLNLPENIKQNHTESR